MTLRSIAAAMSAVFLLASCAKDNTSGPDLRSARVRFVHAIADTTALDVRVNGVLTVPLTAVPYGTATEYQSVSGGALALSTQQSPSTNAATPRTIAGLTGITVANGATVTVIGAGEARDTTSGRSAGLTIFLDDITAPPAGQARLRVINASPDLDAVAVYATPTAGGAPMQVTAAAVAYRTASSGVLPAGSYTLTLTPLSAPNMVLATSSAVLGDGAVQTIVVRGYASTLPVGLSTARRLSATVMVNRAP